MAYSLVVLPEVDRVLVTNSSMHDEDPHGHSYQIFRLSDLKLLHTEYFDTGGRIYGEIDPEEPRRGPDGFCFRSDAGVRHRARHGHRHGRSQIEARVHVSRDVLRRADHRRTLFDSERSGRPPKRPYLVVLALVAALSFALSLVATYVAPAVAFFSLPTRAWQLAVGGLVALTAGQWRRLRHEPPRSWDGPGWA